MGKANPILDKSYAFAVRIVKFCEKLERRRMYILAKQLLKSGTSVGANIEEASQGQSKPDFIAKLSISLKEAHEARYWLRLIRDTQPHFAEEAIILIKNAHELIRILVAILKTSRAD